MAVVAVITVAMEALSGDYEGSVKDSFSLLIPQLESNKEIKKSDNREMREKKSRIDTRGGPTSTMGASTNQLQSPNCNTKIMRTAARTVFEKLLSNSQIG